MKEFKGVNCMGFLLFGYVTHGGSTSDQTTRYRLKKILNSNMFISQFRGMYLTPIFDDKTIDDKKNALKEIENMTNIDMWFCYMNRKDFEKYFEVYNKEAV